MIPSLVYSFSVRSRHKQLVRWVSCLKPDVVTFAIVTVNVAVTDVDPFYQRTLCRQLDSIRCLCLSRKEGDQCAVCAWRQNYNVVWIKNKQQLFCTNEKILIQSNPHIYFYATLPRRQHAAVMTVCVCFSVRKVPVFAITLPFFNGFCNNLMQMSAFVRQHVA